jgi:hypothetical protein
MQKSSEQSYQSSKRQFQPNLPLKQAPDLADSQSPPSGTFLHRTHLPKPPILGKICQFLELHEIGIAEHPY